MSKLSTVLLVILFSYAALPVLAQQWESVGGGVNNDIRGIYVDTTEDKIYIVGHFYEVGGQAARKIAVWDGSVWTSLNNNLLTGSIVDIIKYKGELIVSGSPYYLDTNQIVGGLAKLTTLGWRSFNPVLDKGKGLMNVIDDELYLHCCFDSVNGLSIKNIAKWNGTVWDSIGNQKLFNPNDKYVEIGTIAKYQNKLIEAGNFSLGYADEIVQFDGVNWLALGDGVKGEAWINKIIVYKDILYIGGWFQKAAGNPSSYLMAWDGSKWFNPFPEVEFSVQVFDMNVIDDELYIVGNYKFLNDPKGFAFSKYDGENFCAFGGSYATATDQDAGKIVGLNGELFIACNRTMFGDTLNYFAKWIGTAMDSCIYSPMASISELSQTKTAFEISPNPSTNNISIHWQANLSAKQEFFVYDQLGKKVLEKKHLSLVGQNSCTIDVSGLAKGVYFLDAGSQRIKLVKE